MATKQKVEIAGAVLLRDARLLLGLRAPGRRSYPNSWDMIGGHVEAGETPAQAITRELAEEIGVTPTTMAPVTVLDINAANERTLRLSVFVVTAWRSEPVLANDEHVALQWFTLEQACALASLADPSYPGIFRQMVDVSKEHIE